MEYKALNNKEFDEFIQGCKVLETEGEIPVVWRRDDEIIKRFRVHRRLSSNLLRPYASRFARNSAALLKLGITAPEVLAGYRLAEGDRVLVYRRLPGTSVSELSPPITPERLAGIYNSLHEKGVIFRSVHLSNILLQESGGFGLIDITDVKFRGRPLSVAERAANLGYAWAHPRDADYFTAERMEQVISAYTEIAGFIPGKAESFRKLLQTKLAAGKARRLKRSQKKS